MDYTTQNLEKIGLHGDLRGLSVLDIGACAGYFTFESERPGMALYPASELNRDPTNWCGPNPAMVKAMLQTVGFRRVQVHAGPFYFPPRTLGTLLRSLVGGRLGRVAEQLTPRSPRMV